MNPLRKTAIFGGSFDPVHLGHLIVADEILSQCGYERIVFVPAAMPPHKTLSRGASSHDRLAMVRAAIDGRDDFDVYDGELQRGGRSFTIDTVRELQRSAAEQRTAGASAVHDDERLGLVIGADLVAGFRAWHDYARLVDMVQMIVVRRPGFEIGAFDLPHRFVDNPLVDVSSTEIRRRISCGQPYRYFVGDAVCGYIERHGLYR